MMDRAAAVFRQKLRTWACLQLFEVADAWVLKPDLKSCSCLEEIIQVRRAKQLVGR
jgi:hypothetical protein